MLIWVTVLSELQQHVRILRSVNQKYVKSCIDWLVHWLVSGGFGDGGWTYLKNPACLFFAPGPLRRLIQPCVQYRLKAKPAKKKKTFNSINRLKYNLTEHSPKQHYQQRRKLQRFHKFCKAIIFLLSDTNRNDSSSRLPHTHFNTIKYDTL